MVIFETEILNFSEEEFSKTAQIQFVNDFAADNLELNRNELEFKSNAMTMKDKLSSIDHLNIWVRSKVAESFSFESTFDRLFFDPFYS